MTTDDMLNVMETAVMMMRVTIITVLVGVFMAVFIGMLVGVLVGVLVIFMLMEMIVMLMARAGLASVPVKPQSAYHLQRPFHIPDIMSSYRNPLFVTVLYSHTFSIFHFLLSAPVM